jgi:hypothetical protein
MNRRFLLAWLVVFIGWMVGSFIIHGGLLRDEYARLPHLFRPEADAQRYFPLMLLAHAIMAGRSSGSTSVEWKTGPGPSKAPASDWQSSCSA